MLGQEECEMINNVYDKTGSEVNSFYEIYARYLLSTVDINC